ncbi:MAG: type II toxin-antitoxin system VapC family toxin, partial [Planctomycetes bacterium]|nr:type II toxin-antitoxin system VapC family toxin [Planctomycetota bacterium]
MASVYIETTIVGHVPGRVHPDPFVAARQQATRDWWRGEAPRYELFISQLVLEECSEGDPSAAAERLEVVKDLDLLEASDEVDDLADALISEKAVPISEPRDAFHIAIAVVNGVDYLLTWHCKH